MRGYRLPRPHRTDLSLRPVAESEHEVHHRRVGSFEFAPVLRAKMVGAVIAALQYLQREGIDGSGREAARTVAAESRSADALQHSAMMLRAELPVQRNSTLYCSRCFRSSLDMRMRLLVSDPCKLRSTDEKDVTE